MVGSMQLCLLICLGGEMNKEEKGPQSFLHSFLGYIAEVVRMDLIFLKQ